MIGKKIYPADHADIRRKEIRNLRTSPKPAGKIKNIEIGVVNRKA